MKKIIALISIAILFTVELSANESGKVDSSSGAVMNFEFIPGKGVVIEQLQEISVVVKNIDYQNRLLTVVDEDDVQSTFNITQAVDDINKINNGDSVVLTGYVGIVMQLVDSLDDIDQSSMQLLSNELSDEKLTLIEVDQIIQTVAEITEIDDKTRTITITGADGGFIDLIVPEYAEKFDDLNLGDKVSAAYVQAFAVSVKVTE